MRLENPNVEAPDAEQPTLEQQQADALALYL